jgi:polysaccharide deacetylase family protein (PEP-CTERM system associated)
MLNAFTVDVEDYYHVSAFAPWVDRRRWDDYESRVVASTRRILELMDAHEVRGTFFVLGWVAERYPGLVRDIHARGHEIGSHSYWHRLVYDLAPDEFRDDLRRSREAIEKITGDPVTAYRAPSFSVTKKSLWALDILREEGFLVDSSISPVRHDRYGIPSAPRRLHEIATPSGSLWEFPASVTRIGRMNVKVSGGGYFRLYPYSFTRRCLAQINRKEREPFVFYVHPWEIDPDQPRLPVGSHLSRFRHFVNLRTTQGKLGRLLKDFHFGRMSDVIRQSRAPAAADRGRLSFADAASAYAP